MGLASDATVGRAWAEVADAATAGVDEPVLNGIPRQLRPTPDIAAALDAITLAVRATECSEVRGPGTRPAHALIDAARCHSEKTRSIPKSIDPIAATGRAAHGTEIRHYKLRHGVNGCRSNNKGTERDDPLGKERMCTSG